MKQIYQSAFVLAGISLYKHSDLDLFIKNLLLRSIWSSVFKLKGMNLFNYQRHGCMKT